MQCLKIIEERLIFKPQNGGEDVYGDLAPPNKVINYDSPMFRDNSVNSRL